MKKSIIYETPDGQKFTTRRQALRHETNLTRRAEITRFLLARTKLKQVSDSVSVEHVIEVLCAAAEEVKMLLSARYARTLANLPGPKRRALPEGRPPRRA